MTEQEYIDAKSLGVITSAINTISELSPEIMDGVIKDGEMKMVRGTLHKWFERLHAKIKIQEFGSSSDVSDRRELLTDFYKYLGRSSLLRHDDIDVEEVVKFFKVSQ